MQDTVMKISSNIIEELDKFYYLDTDGELVIYPQYKSMKEVIDSVRTLAYVLQEVCFNEKKTFSNITIANAIDVNRDILLRLQKNECS